MLVGGGDATALDRAIGRMATDPELRERLGQAARNRAADFSAERLVEATANVYLRLTDLAPRDDAV